jgi:hypothetical protein
MSINELTVSGGSALVAHGCCALKLADGRPMLLEIPASDTAEFMAEHPDQRYRVLGLFIAFREMGSTSNIKSGAMRAAMARRNIGRGWSAKSLMDLFRAYKCGGHKPGDWRKKGPSFPPGDWRILTRDYQGKPLALPEEFKSWLTEQLSQFRGRKDCVSALYRHVIQAVWLKGLPIPSYGTVDEWCRLTGRARPHPHLVRPGELPDGWSLSTFRRALPKRQATRAQIAGGYLLAHTHQPDQVLTDRSPLMPLQFVIMDDHRVDRRCLHFSGGRGEFVYPLIVGGVDACSAVDTAMVGKPRCLKRSEQENSEEKAVREGVTQDMALLVVINTLREFGLPEGYPITFVHEKAAACIPSHAKHLLREAYGDRIQFMATSTFEAKMMQHGFRETGGQPYAKALVEVLWRILETQLARQPLATGPRYDDTPTEVKEAEIYTLKLLDKVGGIEQALAKLALPALTFEQAYDGVVSALRLLRFRTNHRLQGFDRVREWRMNPADNYRPIEELSTLSPAEQAKVEDIIERLECPAERFVRLARGVKFAAVDENLLTYIEGTPRQVNVRDGKISVRAQEIGDDMLVFRESNNPLLDEDAEGRSYDAVLSPDGSRIVLAKDGRILGCVFAQERVNRADTRALHQEQLRVRQARIADREAFAQYALGDQNDTMQRMRLNNAAVVAEAKALQGGAAAAAIEAPRRAGAKKEQSATEILNARAAKAGLVEDEV